MHTTAMNRATYLRKSLPRTFGAVVIPSPVSGRPRSLDHLVGAAEKPWRDRKPERARGLHVDDKLEGRGDLDRQVGGIGALENAPGIAPDLAIGFADARAVARETARRRVLAPRIDGRQGVALRQRHDGVAAVGEERIGADQEGARAVVDHGVESAL